MYEIHTKHINTLCGKNREFQNVKPGGTYSNHTIQSVQRLRYGLDDRVHASSNTHRGSESTRRSSPDLKRLEREANHSTISSTEHMNAYMSSQRAQGVLFFSFYIKQHEGVNLKSSMNF